jgi:hypothetical protein
LGRYEGIQNLPVKWVGGLGFSSSSILALKLPNIFLLVTIADQVGSVSRRTHSLVRHAPPTSDPSQPVCTFELNDRRVRYSMVFKSTLTIPLADKRTKDLYQVGFDILCYEKVKLRPLEQSPEH